MFDVQLFPNGANHSLLYALAQFVLKAINIVTDQIWAGSMKKKPKKNVFIYILEDSINFTWTNVGWGNLTLQ